MKLLNEQIQFISDCLKSQNGIDSEMYLAILKSLKLIDRNALPLHAERKRCPACGKAFTSMNNLQECCDSKCRVNLHRSKNRLKNFNQRVSEILKAKDPDAKYVIEQIIVSDRKCPFVVFYNGKRYQSDNTRNLLSILRKA